MTKKTTTSNRAQLAKAENNLPVSQREAIRSTFQACEIIEPIVHTWPTFLETVCKFGIEAERRYIVQFTDSAQWQEFLDLIEYDTKTRAIPENRDEKKGHLETLKTKDIPTLESFDHRRGMHSINLHTMHLIDAGHRTRAITDHWTRQKTGSVTIAIRFTDATSEGFDGSQAQWTTKDQAKTALKAEGYSEEASAFYAKLMDQGGKAIRCRLQNLSIEGGGQSAHKQDGKFLLAAQEKKLWEVDPLYIGVWNLTAKNAEDDNGNNPTSTAGRTVIEIIEEDTLYLQSVKEFKKVRADHLLISLLDAFPEVFTDYAKLTQLLDLLETHLGKVSEAYKAMTSTETSTENRYFWLVGLWKTLDSGHVPKLDQIEKFTVYRYGDGFPSIADSLKEDRKDVIGIVTAS